MSCPFLMKKLKEELRVMASVSMIMKVQRVSCTLLTLMAYERGIEMINLVVEIPVYIQATNPKGISHCFKNSSSLLGFAFGGRGRGNMSERV